MAFAPVHWSKCASVDLKKKKMWRLFNRIPLQIETNTVYRWKFMINNYSHSDCLNAHAQRLKQSIATEVRNLPEIIKYWIKHQMRSTQMSEWWCNGLCSKCYLIVIIAHSYNNACVPVHHRFGFYFFFFFQIIYKCSSFFVFAAIVISH